MDNFLIEGGTPIKGEIAIQGAKNALLPLMISTVLSPGKVRFAQAPRLKDTRFLGEIIEALGGSCQWEENSCILDTTKINAWDPGYEYVSKMRASFLLLGALIGRFGRAKIPLPGGCSIGERPVQWHLEALRQLGVSLNVVAGHVEGTCTHMHGAEITLPFPTVGGTQNIIMAAVFAQGETVINNAAREPEVVALCDFLSESCVPIEGGGTSQIHIQGVKEVQFPLRYTIIPDRIEAVTYAIAAAVTNGDVTLTNCDYSFMKAPLDLLDKAGVSVEKKDTHTLRVCGSSSLKRFELVTGPYPCLSTDLQALFMALALYSKGITVIKETVFSHRFMHALEFARMGAEVTIHGDTVTVQGGNPLTGAPVMASDLRAGAALVLAGLGASGVTTVNRVYHIDRGYVSMEKKLQACGASIQRVAR